MAHHPLRIVHPHKFAGKSDNSRMTAVTLQESVDEIVKQIKNSKGSIVILDQQPNRAISGIYREFLNKIPNGLYVTSPSQEDSTILAIKEMLNKPAESFGFDFENTKLVLSFGAPLLDNWGTPGRMTAIRNSKSCKFVQIDSRYSRTAMQSDQWIALNPGTEKILALNIAYVLLFENLISATIRHSAVDFAQFKNNVKNFNPELTSSVTGITANEVKAIARELISAKSAIILSGADPGGGPFDSETEKAIASLNLLVGNVGKSGGIIARKEIPGYNNNYKQTQWTEIPEHSVSLLIVDGTDSGYTLPWSLIEHTLNRNDNLVVSFSPILNEVSAHSDYLIPAPAYLETITDVPTTKGNRIATFALTTPLIKKQEYTTEPIDVVKEIGKRLHLAIEIPTVEELLKQKVNAIYAEKRGSIYIYADQSSTNVNDLSSADELWTKLTEGAEWIDEECKQKQSNKYFFNLSPLSPVPLEKKGMPMIAYGWRGATSASQVSPILSKVFQETELRNVNGVISINPTTAQKLGIVSGESVSLSTKNGTMNVTVKIVPTVRPGTIEASIAPLPNGIETPMNPSGSNILNLCEVTDNGTWRITNATLLKV